MKKRVVGLNNASTKYALTFFEGIGKPVFITHAYLSKAWDWHCPQSVLGVGSMSEEELTIW